MNEIDAFNSSPDRLNDMKNYGMPVRMVSDLDLAAACDIGCDEYGYPIRQQAGGPSYAAAELAVVKAEIRRLRALPPWNTSISPAGLAAGTVPNALPRVRPRAMTVCSDGRVLA